jgi:phage regulator Rha-like protein
MYFVELKNNIPVISSSKVSKECGIEHRSVLQQISAHYKDFEDFGTMHKGKEKLKRGRPLEVCYLREEHFVFLITLLQNSKKAVYFKKLVTKEFFNLRKQLIALSINKSNQIWLDERKNIKQVRKSTTDTIKRFVEYAKEQGSSNADRYYCNITKMENKALFVIETKYKNIRDVLNLKQLSELKQADEIIEKALDDGMNENMNYKDIFKLAKKRVTMFSELKGKSIIPELMQIGE